MTSPIPYDPSYRPSAPVVPVGVSTAGVDVVMVPMLIDTGADVSILPSEIVRSLRLPRVDTIIVSGFGGARVQAAVHAATLALGNTMLVARVVASDDARLGRDILENFEVELDGPRARLILRAPAAPMARRPGRRAPRSPGRK